MSSNQLWGPEEDMPDLISDDSEEEQEAVVARAPRPPRPDAEALLTLGVSTDAAVRLHARLQVILSNTCRHSSNSRNTILDA